MKMRDGMFCAGAWAILLTRALAQDQNPVPTAPYLAPVPDPGHWTVSLVYPPTSPTAPGVASPAPQLNADQPLAIDFVRGGGISAVTFTFQGSPTVRVDAKGTFSFLPGPQGPLIYNAGSQFPISFYTTSFLFAEWLRHQGATASYEVVEYRNVRCFHYTNKQPAPHSEIYDPGYGSEVWINIKTMLPVASKWNGVEADFNFLPPPGSPPQLTPEETALIQYKENLSRAIDSIR